VAVQAEVFAFYEAIFRGRHVAADGASGPVDSGASFVPDEAVFARFLPGLPRLSDQQRDMLEAPFTYGELAEAVRQAANGRSPGLDGLPYELYKVVLPQVGPPLLDALNGMLEAGELEPSLRRGVVRLIPKKAGTPSVDQLRPITLLCTDYKLLTKMLAGRMLTVLPTVLRSSQLCSVRGRSIFEGPAAILSAAEYLHQRKLPGFLLSLDFFHAYDRVCLQWVDKVLEAMGFGPLLRRTVSTLHKGASASFLLHEVSPALEIAFSIRQGDPASSILFTIHIEPFLAALESALKGLSMAGLQEIEYGYMDDVNELGEDDEDITLTDEICRAFEAASGAILNRNCKTSILGLGSWAGRQDWPLPWLRAAPSVKAFGVVFTPTHQETVVASWERVIAGIEKVLNMWQARRLPTLRQKAQALEVYGLSKAWYLAQILPLPKRLASRLQKAAGDFLWRGRLERLAYDELHVPLSEGGLKLSAIAERAQSLLAKQACHRLAAGGKQSQHIAYWVGLRLRHALPALAAGPHAEAIPAFFKDLCTLLLEVFRLPSVSVSSLGEATAAGIYADLVSTPPPPKVEGRIPDLPWSLIWSRLSLKALPASAVDVGFSALHNILPLQVRRHRFNIVPTPACPRCQAPVEDVVHFFTGCPRVAEAWEFLAHRAALCLGGAPVQDRLLLFLAWPRFPPSAAENAVALAVVVFCELAWSTRAAASDLSPEAVRSAVDAAAAVGPFPSIFCL
jgi:hypothetical protein